MGLLRAGRIVLGVGLLLAVGGAAGLAAYGWRPAIDPIDPPAAASFDPAAARRCSASIWRAGGGATASS